jgi:hypothetical protein
MRRTTVRIDETLLNEAKAFAARQGRSLNSVMEDALRQLMNHSAHLAERPRVELPSSEGKPGYQPEFAVLFAADGRLDHLAYDLGDDEGIGVLADATR